MPCLQYEEPTSEVQALREKIELERSHKAPWLRDLAAQQGQSSIAMNGRAGEQLPTSLALCAEELARAQKQLHIPKQQVKAGLPVPGWPLYRIRKPVEVNMLRTTYECNQEPSEMRSCVHTHEEDPQDFHCLSMLHHLFSNGSTFKHVYLIAESAMINNRSGFCGRVC